MEYLKIIAVGIFTLLVAYLTICVLSPKKVAASKTIVVHHSEQSVIEDLSDLEFWQEWHPYLDSAKEGRIVTSTNKIEWVSSTNTGGKIEVDFHPDSGRISFTTAFEKAGVWKAYQGEFLLEGNERETKISWIYVGEEFPFFKRPANYFIKEVIEKTMELGLFRLKKSLRQKDYPNLENNN